MEVLLLYAPIAQWLILIEAIGVNQSSARDFAFLERPPSKLGAVLSQVCGNWRCFKRDRKVASFSRWLLHSKEKTRAFNTLKALGLALLGLFHHRDSRVLFFAPEEQDERERVLGPHTVFSIWNAKKSNPNYLNVKGASNG